MEVHNLRCNVFFI